MHFLSSSAERFMLHAAKDKQKMGDHNTPSLSAQAMGGSLAEVEWDGILHWKTWALAALDVCISTTKCASTSSAAPTQRRPSPTQRRPLPVQRRPSPEARRAIMASILQACPASAAVVHSGRGLGVACHMQQGVSGSVLHQAVCSDAGPLHPDSSKTQTPKPWRRYAVLYITPLIIYHVG